ncbi:hypothetical protein HK098_002622 [Nowakowskiella sp. JEL0407]|nr:hypothetical protein HK098_002622 [Nowakowskiella sp. JEL0407]
MQIRDMDDTDLSENSDDEVISAGNSDDEDGDESEDSDSGHISASEAATKKMMISRIETLRARVATKAISAVMTEMKDGVPGTLQISKLCSTPASTMISE